MSDVRFTRSIDKDHLARLKAAREQADAAYNAALSALDAALPAVPAMPRAPAAPDETQVTPLNERFAIVGGTQLPGGLKGLLLRPVWGFLAPMFARQEAFNAALVDHVNRNVAAARSVHDGQVALIETLRLELERLATFHSALIVYLQQITPYVDSKDHEFDGLATRRVEDVGEAVETLHHRTVGPGGRHQRRRRRAEPTTRDAGRARTALRGPRGRARCGARPARAVARRRHARDPDAEAGGGACSSGTGNRQPDRDSTLVGTAPEPSACHSGDPSRHRSRRTLW